MADSLRDRVIAACSAKPGSAEDYPFGDEVRYSNIPTSWWWRLPRAERDKLNT
jgi:hypothetical protein